MTFDAKLRAAVAVAGIVMALGCAAARADEVPLVTGVQWTQSSAELKKAYLVGIANLAQVEQAYGTPSPAPDAQSIVPRMVRGLRGQTLDSVREGLDRWYAANPGRLQRPVLETIWFEMVVPGLRKAP